MLPEGVCQFRLRRFLLRHEQEPRASMVHDDRLREPHASRSVLRPATPGRLNEKGRVAVEQQESVRAKSAHSTLFGGRKKTQILQFVGFSVGTQLAVVFSAS
jgi:hypothetical protein